MSHVLSLVIGMTAEPDDSGYWLVAAYRDRQQAEAHAARARQAVAAFIDRYGSSTMPWPEEQQVLALLTAVGYDHWGEDGPLSIRHVEATTYRVESVPLSQSAPEHDPGWEVPGRWPQGGRL